MSNNNDDGGAIGTDDTSIASRKKADINENKVQDGLETDEKNNSQTMSSEEIMTSAKKIEEKMGSSSKSPAKAITDDNHGAASDDDDDDIGNCDGNNDAGHCDALDAEDKTTEADLNDDFSTNDSGKDDCSIGHDAENVGDVADLSVSKDVNETVDDDNNSIDVGRDLITDSQTPPKASGEVDKTTKLSGISSSNTSKRSSGKRPPSQISQTLQAGATETSAKKRRRILAEVREHLDILKDFEGAITEEEMSERKRQLFLFSTSAVPVLSSSPSQAGIEAENDEICEPNKKMPKKSSDSDSSDDDEEGTDDLDITELVRARLRKEKPPPGTKKERLTIVTVYAEKLLEQQIMNQSCKQRRGKPTKMVKEAQKTYPWMTVSMVNKKAHRMKKNMKKKGELYQLRKLLKKSKSKDLDSSDDDEKGIDRKQKNDVCPPSPRTKRERMKVVTEYAQQVLDGQLRNRSFKERFGATKNMVKEAQMIYPWITVNMVNKKAHRMKVKMKKEGLI